jgi:hypothetical protein
MAEVLIPVLLVGCLVTSVAIAGEQGGTVASCEGPYVKRMPTPEELTMVLDNHRGWVESGEKPDDQRRANLCQANLAEASLVEANLQGASLVEANLQKANLYKANLERANLYKTNFQKAILVEAKLQKAYLVGANLQGASLVEANLQNVNLQEANLQKANLHRAKLQEAWLEGTKLQEAWLVGANLQGASLVEVNLAGAVFEPILEPTPDIRTLINPHTRLDTLVFHTSPGALITLREALKKAGMRTQERQLTYAVEHTKMLQAWDPSIIENTWRRRALLDMKELKDERPWQDRLSGKIDSLFSYVLFELPSAYGMVPSRALWSLLVFIPCFALFYWIVLQGTKSHSGLWVIVPADRIALGRGKEKIVRIKRHSAKT